MGIFDFLKKKETKEIEYELPPLPPLDELHQKDDNHKKPLFPVIPEEHAVVKTEEHAFKKNNETVLPKEHKEPEVVSKQFISPIIEKPHAHVSFKGTPLEKSKKEIRDIPEELPEFPFSKPELKDEYLSKEELRPMKEIPTKPIFINVHHYRKVLGDLTTISSDFSLCGDVIERMNNIRNDQDKFMNTWSSSLEDLQRKFLFIDKTLFEIKYT